MAMENLFNNILEILFFFSLGYISVRFRFFPVDYSKAYTDFIINVGFPALVFYNIYNLKITVDLLTIVIMGYMAIGLSIVASIFIGRMLKYDPKTLSSFILLSSFGNTGFLGYPFALSLYGEEALRYAVVFDNIAMFLPVYILSPFILSYGMGSEPKVDIKRVLLFPSFVALVVAIVLKGFPVPSVVLEISKTLGETVIPLILFSVGMNIKFSHIRSRFKDVLYVILLKSIIIPFIFLVGVILIGVELSLPVKVAILQISMPPMILASILIINSNLDKELAVSAVATGIVISFLSVPVIYFLMELYDKL